MCRAAGSEEHRSSVTTRAIERYLAPRVLIRRLLVLLNPPGCGALLCVATRTAVTTPTMDRSFEEIRAQLDGIADTLTGPSAPAS